MSINLLTVTPHAEREILYIARVSSDQSNEAVGLLRYLIRNKHWSPFEHASATFEIVTSRAIAAQILRHRSFVFQEFSQRYAKPEETIKVKARRQAESNRQSSVDDLNPSSVISFDALQADVEDFCFEAYETAINMGVAKEQARFLLPLATATTLYMTGSIRSWIHYFELRCDEHTQQEHRELALDMRKQLAGQLPTISEALGWQE